MKSMKLVVTSAPLSRRRGSYGATVLLLALVFVRATGSAQAAPVWMQPTKPPYLGIALLAALFLTGAFFCLALKLRVLGKKLRLTESELQVAKGQVAADVVAKGRFLAMMGHELRTPMNAILGFSELLHEERLGEEADFYIDNIEKSGRHLTDLFEKVIDYAKAETGALQLIMRPFRLRSTLEELRLEFADSVTRKSLTYVCTVDSQLPEQWVGDAMRLKQILRQAIVNAIKFTDEGEIRLLVSGSLPKDESAPVALLFTICDTGLGISEAYLPQAFTPFSQEDSGVTRRFGGLGLGLSLVKELTDLKGGTLNLQSEVGRGTILSVSLPLKRVLPLQIPRPSA